MKIFLIFVHVSNILLLLQPVKSSNNTQMLLKIEKLTQSDRMKRLSNDIPLLLFKKKFIKNVYNNFHKDYFKQRLKRQYNSVYYNLAEISLIYRASFKACDLHISTIFKLRLAEKKAARCCILKYVLKFISKLEQNFYLRFDPFIKNILRLLGDDSSNDKRKKKNSQMSYKLRNKKCDYERSITDDESYMDNEIEYKYKDVPKTTTITTTSTTTSTTSTTTVKPRIIKKNEILKPVKRTFNKPEMKKLSSLPVMPNVKYVSSNEDDTQKGIVIYVNFTQKDNDLKYIDSPVKFSEILSQLPQTVDYVLKKL